MSEAATLSACVAWYICGVIVATWAATSCPSRNYQFYTEEADKIRKKYLKQN